MGPIYPTQTQLLMVSTHEGKLNPKTIPLRSKLSSFSPPFPPPLLFYKEQK